MLDCDFNGWSGKVAEPVLGKQPGGEPARESEEMFRSIVENSHAGIFIIDGSFHIVYANERLSILLGYPLSEIIGSDFRRFLDEESSILVADRYARRQRGRKFTLPLRNRRYPPGRGAPSS